MTDRKSLLAVAALLAIFCLLFCSLSSAQITCASGTACQGGSVAVFASSGSQATVTDSLIQQSGSTVTVTGNVSANIFEIGGSAFAFGSVPFSNAFLGFAGNSATAPTGGENTAVGRAALYDLTDGYSNTAVGYGALDFTTSGQANTAIGGGALQNNTTGTGNTAVGFGAGVSTANLSNTTAVGYLSSVSESNALVLGGTGTTAVSVGIGTGSPYYDYGLTVTAGGQNNAINGGIVVGATGGNLYLGMTNGTHKFRVDTNGAVYADGGLYSSGADFAESVAVRGERAKYEPGDVLEIDQTARRHLALSSHPYATLVAGVYSTKPGVLASPHHVDDNSLRANEVPLAMVGIVPCKVTAENGPIAAGDLLVTSSVPGYAMKGVDRARMIGAVLGKALEPLPQGQSKGVIEVLVTLQ